MKCRKAKKLILSYAELDLPLKKKLNEHLGSCPHCSHEFSLHLKSINLLKDVISFEGSTDFWKGYQVNLKRKIPPSPFWSRFWTKVEDLTSLFRTPVLGPVPAYVFSFALLVLLTLSFYPGFFASQNAPGFKNNLVVYEGELLSSVDDGGVTIYTLEGR
jgi:hypothetical protein